MSIRGRLIQLVLAAAIPGVLLSALATWIAYREQLEIVQSNLLQTVRTVASLYDHELGKGIARLESLASSPLLTSDDLAGFHAQVNSTVTPQLPYWITLNHADTGQQILSSRVPFGSALYPYASGESRMFVKEVVETRQPFIRNLSLNRQRQQHVVALQVPVIRDGQVKYAVNLIYAATVLQQLLDDQQLPREWLVTVLDRSGMSVARSVDAEKHRMRPPSPSLQEAIAKGPFGITRTRSLEGIEVVTAYARAADSGWTVAFGVPAAGILAQSLQNAIWPLIGGIALTLLAILFAVRLGNRIAQPMEQLTQAAGLIGKGQPIVLPRSEVKEIEAVAGALRTATGELHLRTEERARHDAALRELNATLEQRVARRTAELAAANQRLSAEIEQRKHAETALVHAQKLESVGQLTGGIAHDFNNLLAAVLGCFRLLERRVDAPARELIRHGRSAADRGVRLTQQLLAFSRKQMLNARPTDLNGVISRMSDLLHHTLGGHIGVVTVLAPDLWPATADDQQIDLCVLNLVINARDAMPKGGQVCIETANVPLADGLGDGLPPGDYVCIRVVDSGEGMSEEVLNKAFEPFFTTKEVGKGSGLGLSMVYGTVRQLGGDVRIVSAPGKGTTVALYLPRAHADAATLHTAVPGEKIIEVRPANILLADDDHEVRIIVAEMLRDLGHTVIEAPSGLAAIEILRMQQPIDLLLADYAMPGITGAELLARARALDPSLPVVIVTGYAELAAPALSGVTILKKPLSPGMLANVIARIVDHTRDNVVPLRPRAGA